MPGGPVELRGAGAQQLAAALNEMAVAARAPAGPDAVQPFGSRLLGPADQPYDALRVRTRLMATAGIVVANLVGVVVVTVLSWWVLPRPAPLSHRMFVANAVAIPIYVVAAIALGVAWGTRLVLTRVAWALERRSPQPGDQRAALRAPLALVSLEVTLWGLAVVVFSVLAQLVQPAMTANVALTVALGGAVTCAATYLMMEFILRPVAARALIVDPPDDLLVPGIETRWLLAWALGSGGPVAGLMIVAAFALVRGDASPTQLAITMLALGATTLAVGLLLAWLAVRATVDPIRGLRSAVQRVEHGDYDTEILVYDGSEVGLLQAAFNRMVAGLRERERIRDLFGRHVGDDVAREALARDIELGGELRDVAVLFVDIVGSTALAAQQPATEVVDLLNRFFAVVIDVVTACGGSINKFEGDAAMAVFGTPVRLDGHAEAALRAARMLRDRLREAVPALRAGIGVAAGCAVAGNIGGEQRFEYTVIGDPVNQAARLCELSKEAGGLVASLATVQMAGPREQREWCAGEAVVLRGRSTPTRLATPRPH